MNSLFYVKFVLYFLMLCNCKGPLTFCSCWGYPRTIGTKFNGIYIRYVPSIFFYTFIISYVPQSYTCIVTSRHQIIAIRMKIKTTDTFHVTIECWITLALIKIPFLNDSILICWIYEIVWACKSNTFNSRMVTIEWLVLCEPFCLFRDKIKKLRKNEFINMWFRWISKPIRWLFVN